MSIEIYDSRDVLLKKLYQWDYNISIRIRGVTIPSGGTLPEINFANGDNCLTAYSVTPEIPSGQTYMTALVPNGLLTQSGALRVYFYTNMGADEHRTTFEAVFPIIPRQKPEDYAGGEGGSMVAEIQPLTVSAIGHYPTRQGTAWTPVTVNVGCAYYDSDGEMLPYYRYIVDNISDLALIDNPSFGAVAYCIANGYSYIANSNGTFVHMNNANY